MSGSYVAHEAQFQGLWEDSCLAHKGKYLLHAGRNAEEALFAIQGLLLACPDRCSYSSYGRRGIDLPDTGTIEDGLNHQAVGRHQSNHADRNRYHGIRLILTSSSKAVRAANRRVFEFRRRPLPASTFCLCPSTRAALVPIGHVAVVFL